MCLSSHSELRDYQRVDCELLKKRKSAACFNQQRTGKTPTSIRAIVERGVNKTVVVCPKSAVCQWQKEWTIWSDQPAYAIVGTPKQKQEALDNWKSGALIISYGSLKSTKTYTGLLQEVLSKQPEAVILDEAHRIKDRTSANALACFQLSSIPIKLALTGTPAPNKPEEIWSILHFLYPQQFKSYWEFVKYYFYTYNFMLSSGKTHIDIGNFKPHKQQELQLILEGIATQRKRKDVMPWLPEKDYQKVLLAPTAKQKRCLEELAAYFETDGVVTQGVLDRLIRYRQICLDPQLLSIKSKSPKTEWVLDYFSDYPQRPTIIFSKFTSYLKILAKALDKYNPKLIIGSTPTAERFETVNAFQNGDCNVLLIQIDAGKEALTLDRAEAIIFTDKFPPVGDIEQAEDRFIATTKEKKDKEHVIYELILTNTYDEEIYKLLQQRASSVECINNFKKYLGGNKT